MEPDIIIVGLGPGGSTLGRILSKKYNVTIIDNSYYHNKMKVCGGLLAPQAQKALARSGLAVPSEVLGGPQVFYVTSLDFDNGLTRHYQKKYINTNRLLFDQWLVGLLGSNVDIIDGTFLSYSQESDGIVVHYKADGQQKTLKANVLIGADGAHSAIRNQMYGKSPNYISLQKWYDCDENFQQHLALFDKNITNYYSWVIPKDGEILVGSAFRPGVNPHEGFKVLECDLTSQGYDLRNPKKTEGCELARPQRVRDIVLGSGVDSYKVTSEPLHTGVYLIGEAARLISPSSAEGISMAIRSGAYLGLAINADPQRFPLIYKKKIRGLIANVMVKKFKSDFMYNSLVRKQVMKSNITSLKMFSED